MQGRRPARRPIAPVADEAGAPQEWWGAEEAAQNEVWAAPKPRRAGKDSGREGCALERLADRLLDWFSVLMDDAGAQPPPRDGESSAGPHDISHSASGWVHRLSGRFVAGFPRDCKPEVRWMFAHLDTDGDGLLSAHNLYALSEYPPRRRSRPRPALTLGWAQGMTSASSACGRSWRSAAAARGCRAARGAAACGARRGLAWR